MDKKQKIIITKNIKKANIYEPEDLVALILKNIKNCGEKIIGCSVDDVVIGRPVIVSDDQKKDAIVEKRLKKAPQIAGFINIKFQLEVFAVALNYEKTINDGEEKIFLIGDFGGGTSDFFIVKPRGGGRINIDRKNDVLSVGGGVCGRRSV